MESTHLLGGSKKKVKIHPHTVTAKYATHPPFSPQPTIHTHFPQPGDEGYDDAPSFEDFGSFLDDTSDRKKLTEGRKWPGRTLFGGGGGKEKNKDTPLKPTTPGGAHWGCGGDVKGASGGGVGEQLASFGEASVSASRLTWVGLLVAALASGCVAVLTRLASERFGLGPLFLLLVRSVLQLVSLAVPLQRGEHPFGPVGYRVRLSAYGIAYSLSLCCAYSALSFVSPDDATTTWRLATTVLSATLAFLLLEERLGLADGVAVATGVCGLVLALIPATDSETGTAGVGPGSAEDAAARFWRSAFGWSLAAMAGLWMALALVAYRSLKERVGVGTALFTVSWTGCLLATASMVLLQEGAVWPSGPTAWVLLLGVIVCAVGAFLGVTHALSRIHPTLVSAAQSLEIPVAVLLQTATLPLAPTVCQVVGAVVVAVSVGWLLVMKLLPSHSTGRRQREEYEEILDSPIK